MIVSASFESLSNNESNDTIDHQTRPDRITPLADQQFF